MQVEVLLANAPQPRQPHFDHAPKALDPINVPVAFGELVLGVVNPVVAFVAPIDQGVIGRPAIGIDGAVGVDSSLDHSFEGRPGGVRNDLGIDLALAFEDAKDNDLFAGPATLFAPDPAGAKIAFVDLNLAFERRLGFASAGDLVADLLQNPVDGFAIEVGRAGYLDSI